MPVGLKDIMKRRGGNQKLNAHQSKKARLAEILTGRITGWVA